MLEIREMSRDESAALLARAAYGHLGCARDGHPYVVPMNYACDGRDIYFFTTEGTKTEFISANREVCFQVGVRDVNRPAQSRRKHVRQNDVRVRLALAAVRGKVDAFVRDNTPNKGRLIQDLFVGPNANGLQLLQ